MYPKRPYHSFTFRVFTLALLAVALAACTLTNPLVKPVESVKVLEFSQICAQRGCPEFVMQVFSDGNIFYDGKAFTPYLGVYTRTLPKDQMATLDSLIRTANLWSAAEHFPLTNPDAPVSQLRAFEAAYTKEISGQQFTSEIQQLINQLNAVVLGGGWKQTAPPAYGLPEGTSPNVLRIQLKEGLNYEYWQGKYFDYGMIAIKMLPEANNYWIFRFDPSRIPPLTMKELLANDPEVIRFEFEKAPKK